MSLISKLQNDIDLIEKSFPQYQLINSKNDERGILVYTANNVNTNKQEKLTIGLDADNTRKLCRFNESKNKWEVIGEL